MDANIVSHKGLCCTEVVTSYRSYNIFTPAFTSWNPETIIKKNEITG